MFRAKSLRFLSSLIIIVSLILLVSSPPFKTGSASATIENAVTTQEIDWTESCTEIGVDPISATAVSDTLWSKNVLRVRFLDGTPELRSKVELYAAVWSEFAAIKFDFTQEGPSDIRISFVHNGRSWSYIGNSAEKVDKSKATMNFGWFDKTTAEVELRRVILHEFGHVLGLVHEHQSPMGTINWNKQFIYKYYEKPPF